MSFRTTTLTTALALVLGAGGALAQQEETTITVPLGSTTTAAPASDDIATSATPAVGTGASTPAADAAPQPETDTTVPISEPATAAEPADTVAPPAEAVAPADAPTPVDAAEPVVEPVADTVAPAPMDVAPADAAEATPTDVAEPVDTAAAPVPAADAPEATADEAPAAAGADVSSDDPAASVEGEIVAAPVASEDPVEAETDAAAEPGTGDATLEATEAENQAARTAGEIAAEEAPAASPAHVSHITDVAYSFEGPFGTFDQFQLQRGLQVYTEVCSSCHGMRYVPLRTLSDESGPGMPLDQVRAYAANLDITDAETGEDRPRLPTDNFPHVSGEGMGPDLSLMAKARAGFHGPYGTGISQFFNGIGGPEYIYSVLTGYTEETKDEAGSTFYENAAFPGGWIQMPPPLSDDLVTYEDGHPATVENMAEDLSAFLMWAAEPHMMARKQTGLVSVIFLIVLTALLYLTNKRIWLPIKRRREH